MDDLISRQAAIDALNVLVKDGHAYVNGAFFETILRDEAKRVLEELPSAQPEQRKGKWIHPYHYGLALPEHECSVCHEWEYADTESNFCPNCGADMRGDEHETD